MQEHFTGGQRQGQRRDFTNDIIVTSPARPVPKPESEAVSSGISHQKNRRSFKKFLIVLLLIAMIAGALGFWQYSKNSSGGPLPKTVRQSVKYPLYYPTPVPAGYKLDHNSVKSTGQLVFYNLVSASNTTISISEQAVPKNPPDFDALQKFNTSFKKLDVISGRAIYGVSRDVPVGVLITNTTMISLYGSKNTPIDVIAKLIQNMSSTF
jgi:hypothetical protein